MQKIGGRKSRWTVPLKDWIVSMARRQKFDWLIDTLWKNCLACESDAQNELTDKTKVQKSRGTTHLSSCLRHVFAQVFMKFSQPWWTFSKEQGNRAVSIQYSGNMTAGRKAGATGITDNKLAQVQRPPKVQSPLAKRIILRQKNTNFCKKASTYEKFSF